MSKIGWVCNFSSEFLNVEVIFSHEGKNAAAVSSASVKMKFYVLTSLANNI